MIENRRYYYLKLKESFYNSETMVVLESMPDGLLYSNLLMKMYLMSLKSNGILMLNDHIPHTPQTIATYTRHQVGTVEKALRVFIELDLIEILTDGAYYMCDIQLLIGQSSTEGERKKQARVRLQLQKLLPPAEVDTCPPNTMVDKCPPILELEKDLDTEKKREKENRQISHPYGRYGNVLLADAELAELKSDLPNYQTYIEKLSAYMASSGKQYQNHAATIRRWAEADGQKSGLPDYSFKEGESL